MSNKLSDNDIVSLFQAHRKALLAHSEGVQNALSDANARIHTLGMYIDYITAQLVDKGLVVIDPDAFAKFQEQIFAELNAEIEKAQQAEVDSLKSEAEKVNLNDE